MIREEVERNIEKWREISRPFIDKMVKLNVRRDELLREMEQLQEDCIKALPVKIGDKIMDEDFELNIGENAFTDYIMTFGQSFYKLGNIHAGIGFLVEKHNNDK